MDDNWRQATSAYWSINKHVSGCDIKRDSSFLGDSPSKINLIISDMASAGCCLLPGAAAHQKKNRPVNMRPERIHRWIPIVFNMRPETGHKKGRGGDRKKRKLLPYGLSSPPIIKYPPFADNAFSIWRFSGILSSAPP